MSSTPHRVFTVTQTLLEGAAGVTLVLDAPLAAEPGQFVLVWLPGIEERPFAVVDDDPLTLTIARVGPFTTALCALQPGDRVWVRPTVGHGFPPPTGPLLLLGGGSGTASLALAAKRARRLNLPVTVILGARTSGAHLLAEHFRALGCETILATDDGSLGFRGTVLDAAAHLLTEGWPRALYACGPEPMLRAVAQRAQALDLPCWVSMERTMKCGMGLCGACHCGEQLVCVDGPVFSARAFLAACATPSPGSLSQ